MRQGQAIQLSKMIILHLVYLTPMVHSFSASSSRTLMSIAHARTSSTTPRTNTRTSGDYNSLHVTTRPRILLPSSSSLSSKNINDDDVVNEYKDHSIRDSFNLIALGDLHLEDDMTKHNEARNDLISAIQFLSLLPSPSPSPSPKNTSAFAQTPSQSTTNEHKNTHQIIQTLKQCPAGDLNAAQLEMLLEEKVQGDLMHCHLVSLGDLGRKDIRHEPGDAGTTKSFRDAKEFLEGFNLPYDLITGNHDLEGLDEFDTDEGNLRAWMDCFNKSVPYFANVIGEKTLLVGLSTVRFRDSPHSSHECHADDDQLAWFEQTIRDHSEVDGWRICVFTHAPIMGSNLRVLQNVHIMNGCAWMNHCSVDGRSLFIDIVKRSPQIKLWCSGHFHLSHEFPDSLSRVNQCTFVQVGVVGQKSTRDHTRQTRIVQGNSREFRIYSVNHHVRDEDGNAELRLDATIDLAKGEMKLVDKANLSCSSDENDGDEWFRAYIPQEEDGCYIDSATGRIADEKGECRVMFVNVME
eukprot:scaffold1000_cov252-Chaetoceros_neogracile.AAC.6